MSASTDLYVPQIASALGFDEFICTPACAGARTIGSTDGWRVPTAVARKSAAHLAAVHRARRAEPGRAYGNSAVGSAAHAARRRRPT